MRIGQVSKLAGLAPSAIRYYEQLGLLPQPARRSGRRVFSTDVLDRLALIAHARACGVRLSEMKRLLEASPSHRPSDLWKPLVGAKLKHLEVLEKELAARRKRLVATARCSCASIEACGRLLRTAGNFGPVVP
jgi:MerR family transcriptional regulator, redox-sensitive transcriptional activator SoxR